MQWYSSNKIIYKNINEMLILKYGIIVVNFQRLKVRNFIRIRQMQDGHGWGIESAKSAVKKYDGTIKFRYNKDFFEVIVMIVQDERKI